MQLVSCNKSIVLCTSPNGICMKLTTHYIGNLSNGNRDKWMCCNGIVRFSTRMAQKANTIKII